MQQKQRACAAEIQCLRSRSTVPVQQIQCLCSRNAVSVQPMQCPCSKYNACAAEIQRLCSRITLPVQQMRRLCSRTQRPSNGTSFLLKSNSFYDVLFNLVVSVKHRSVSSPPAKPTPLFFLYKFAPRLMSSSSKSAVFATNYEPAAPMHAPDASPSVYSSAVRGVRH